jgi:geranylgeranylglycerol-phosphate geranylgeranyltransferase
MRRIVGLMELTRPGNLALTALSVLVGTGGQIGSDDVEKVVWVVLSAMLIAAGGNAHNDYCDRRIDAVNRPGRPVPSGRVSPGLALGFSLACYTAGAAGGWLAGIPAGLVAVTVAGLLALYAARGKQMGLAGNFVIALVCALAFIYGGLAVRNPVLAVFPAVFALLMHLAREIIKDVQDLSGDRAAGARTLPITSGVEKALRVSAWSLAGLVLFSPVPYLMGIYNLKYLVAVVLGVDLVLLPVIYQLLQDPRGADHGRLSLILKLDMLAGLMAVALGLS